MKVFKEIRELGVIKLIVIFVISIILSAFMASIAGWLTNKILAEELEEKQLQLMESGLKLAERDVIGEATKELSPSPKKAVEEMADSTSTFNQILNQYYKELDLNERRIKEISDKIETTDFYTDVVAITVFITMFLATILLQIFLRKR